MNQTIKANDRKNTKSNQFAPREDTKISLNREVNNQNFMDGMNTSFAPVQEAKTHNFIGEVDRNASNKYNDFNGMNDSFFGEPTNRTTNNYEVANNTSSKPGSTPAKYQPLIP
jgi:hypothetical protein